MEAVIKSINDIFFESLGSNLIVHKKNAVFTKVGEEKKEERLLEDLLRFERWKLQT